jgi:hypothetical protein
MAKRPSLSTIKQPAVGPERAQEAARVAASMDAQEPPQPASARPAAPEPRPARTVSYHIPNDLAALVEDLAHARFMALRRERDAAKAAGLAWSGPEVRRSATQLAVEALDAKVDAMRAELNELNEKLRR